ncbi:hypothetical protein C5167_025714 [Papaver somniferum]|uniref:SET domain-containing protein n=1 Tax=Papaver somniferum TaxID=3469 RepID=A0A4Y7JW68_PAPSO|nr:hypothetical protein C5167_025714 [Papaver somniferum]
MEGFSDFSLVLALPKDDAFFEKKKKLLQLRGYGPEIQIPFSSSEDPLVALQVMVEVARIIHLDEPELYFGGVEAILPYYSPRNELESLNSVLRLIDMTLKDAAEKKIDVLLLLRNAVIEMIREFGDKSSEETGIVKCVCKGEDELVEWGRNHGVQTKLQIDCKSLTFFYKIEKGIPRSLSYSLLLWFIACIDVEGAGRGAVAAEDLEVGECALEIPVSIIVSEDLVYESDMYHILKQVDGIATETMLLLWSMKERYNSNSKFKLYFETLPEAFNTGLSFGVEALTSLDETLLFEEIMQAKEHLRTQYDELCPALCSNHPDVFQEELYTWEKFLWACELWYSNSMKVIFSDGKLRTCLVPIAGLLNHSVFNLT